jgi:nucleoside-diphosphate-sugar epimerase
MDTQRHDSIVNKILVTGAFGNLGQRVLEEAQRQGIRVVAADLDTPHNRRVARRCGIEENAYWGDVRDSSLEAVLGDIDGLVHLAAVLPPATERTPELARSINVDATARLIEGLERSRSRAVLIYPSSVTVYGPPLDRTRLYRSDDPTRATDQYSAHKIEIERRLAASSIAWVVLRVAVALDARTLGADAATMRTLFDVAPDNPIEYVHPRDVALAMVNAIRRREAHRKVLLVGGGERCRVTHHQFLSAAMEAIGVSLPREILGNAPYYTCWMDTAESQALLEFQRHSFADYRDEMGRRLRWARRALAPFRPLVGWGLRRFLRR